MKKTVKKPQSARAKYERFLEQLKAEGWDPTDYIPVQHVPEYQRRWAAVLGKRRKVQP